jgi:phage-related minor tail protein
MSRKIEEVFNLPPNDEVDDEVDQPIAEEETGFNLSALQHTLDVADKIDQALPVVRDLETLDKDMDKYADEAMKAFKDLMDLGQNVDDRNAAAIFDVAGKMMSNAITAKQTKMDKKLKMIELQMRKAKLDLDTRKVNDALKEKEDDPIEGQAEEFEDRNSLINAVIERMKTGKA